MKRAVAVVAVLILFLCAGTGTVAAQDAQEPVEISNATELQEVREDLDGDYVLVDDIDISGIDNFEPIGSEEEPFTGTFDGNGHKISNLTIDQPDESEVGLFGVVEDGVVENVTLTHVDVIGREHVGSLVGAINRGKVRELSSQGNVTGELRVGGLVGSGGEVLTSGANVHVRGEESVGGTVTHGLPIRLTPTPTTMVLDRRRGRAMTMTRS